MLILGRSGCAHQFVAWIQGVGNALAGIRGFFEIVYPPQLPVFEVVAIRLEFSAADEFCGLNLVLYLVVVSAVVPDVVF
jgi:hypothetical protein